MYEIVEMSGARGSWPRESSEEFRLGEQNAVWAVWYTVSRRNGTRGHVNI